EIGAGRWPGSVGQVERAEEIAAKDAPRGDPSLGDECVAVGKVGRIQGRHAVLETLATTTEAGRRKIIDGQIERLLPGIVDGIHRGSAPGDGAGGPAVERVDVLDRDWIRRRGGGKNRNVVWAELGASRVRRIDLKDVAGMGRIAGRAVRLVAP